MITIITLILIIINFVTVENRIILTKCDQDISEADENSDSIPDSASSETQYDMAPGSSYYSVEPKQKDKDLTNKPCSIVVLSNVQNHSMRSLLRKYRYDARGILIPNSVRYFYKIPHELRSDPILVPLNDRAFSPYGGFVRYYKEVPPIPRTWW